MTREKNIANRMGGIISLLALLLCILIFVFRLLAMSLAEQWLGALFMATALPFIYLLLGARRLHRKPLYYIQLGAILVFIVLELFLDYIYQVDFRSVQWKTILYVMFFFAGTGGLIGVASLAGKKWTYAALILFFLMTLLAFWQRAKTGM